MAFFQKKLEFKKIIEKIKYGEAPGLRNNNKWSNAMIEFVNDCLIKDPLKRPSTVELQKKHKDLLSQSGGRTLIKEVLLENVPSINERVYI